MRIPFALDMGHDNDTKNHRKRIAVGKEMPVSRIVIAVPNTTVVLLD
jgi:hypothetical protein